MKELLVATGTKEAVPHTALYDSISNAAKLFKILYITDNKNHKKFYKHVVR